MKIELKKIEFYDRLSEETNAFTADIYVNGVKAGYAKNDGQGGNTWCHSYEGKSNLLHEAETYAEALPPIQLEFANKIHPTKMNLEMVVDKLFEEYITKKENQKFLKKREKACLTNIVFGLENGTSYKSFGWKGLTIEQLLKIPNGITAIKNAIVKVKAELKEGEKIFNKNIPLEWL